MSTHRRYRVVLAASAVVLLAVAGGLSVAYASGRSAARHPAATVDWPRFGFDPARSDAGPGHTGIGTREARRLRAVTVRLPGTVDSSPIAVHAVRVHGRVRDLFVVTTSYGRTFAIDAANGRVVWHFIPGGIGGWQGSYRIVNASPALDPSRRYVYAAAPNGVIYKLGVGNGREVRGTRWPARITLDPSREKIAAAINVTRRYVIATTGGYVGDQPSYQGHVVTLDRASGRIVHVFNSLCSDRHTLIHPSTCGSSDSAIWARAGAVVEPGSERILVATGNGPFNRHTDWGDSVLELSPDAGRLEQSYTPTNQSDLNANDTDLGSTAPAILPPLRGARTPRTVLQGGKDGKLRLLNLDRLDGRDRRPGAHLGGELQVLTDPGGTEMFTAPAVWVSRGRTWVFVATSMGTAAYQLRLDKAGPRLHEIWQVGTAGTSPVVAGGLLYVYDPGGRRVPGRLVIYHAGSPHRLATLPARPGHWNSPVVIGSHVALPEGNANDQATRGTLEIYSPR